MRTFAAIGLLVVAQGLAGCDGSGSPSALVTPSPAPQPVPQPGPPPAPTAVRVDGWVYDSAFRILAGASVEILDGPQAGTSTTADAMGHFSMTGTVDDTTRFRATMEGHLASIGSLSSSCAGCSARFIYFYLAVNAPPVNMAGEYNLTFVADACVTLPSELQTRTYGATIAPGSNSHSPVDTFYTVAVSGAPFVANYGGFSIGVAGDLVAFELRGEGPTLIEQVAETTYLGFDGRAEARVNPANVSTISAAFIGSINYCALPAPIGQYWDCNPARAVAHAECQSTTHRLILTRR
jgi:hypothetical protein